MSSPIRYGREATPFPSPASPDWSPESPSVWSAQWGSLSPGSQYSSVSEMEEKLRMRNTIDEQASKIRALVESVRALEGTVSALQEEVSHRTESEARTETLLEQSLYKEYEMALKHEDDMEEAGARLRAREEIIITLKRENGLMADDLARARCNLPLQRVDPLQNVYRQTQEEELPLAYCSRNEVERATIEIQRDGRALLTLNLVNCTTISGLMVRSDGAPFDWLEVDINNVWRGDRPGLKLGLGQLTIINLGGFMYMSPRMTALLKRSLERIIGVTFVNIMGLDTIIGALEAAGKPYRNM